MDDDVGIDARPAGNGLPRPRGRHLAALLFALAICAGLRLWLISHREAIGKDATYYVRMARSWRVETEWSTEKSPYHPGFPAVIAAVHALGGLQDLLVHWEMAGVTVAFFFSLLAMVGVYVLATMAFDWRVAWVAVVLFGCGRKWALLGSEVLSDSMSVCLQIWAMVLALGVVRRFGLARWRALWPAAGVGLLAGLGYLVRAEGLVVLAAGIILWLLWRLRSVGNWPVTAGVVAVAVAAAMACVIPYAVSIGGITRKVIFEPVSALPGGAGAMLAVTDHGPSVPLAIALLFEAMQPILGFATVGWLAMAPIALTWPESALGRAFVRPCADATVLTAALMTLYLPLLVGHHMSTNVMSHRYVMAVAAALSPTAASFFMIVARLVCACFGRGRAGRIADRVVLPVVLTAVLVAMISHAVRPFHVDGRECRHAGMFLARVVQPGEVILSSDSRVLYYAGASTHPLGPKKRSADGLRKRLAEAGGQVAYLALSNEALIRAGAVDPSFERLIEQDILRRITAYQPVSSSPQEAMVLFRIDREALFEDEASQEVPVDPGAARSDGSGATP